MVCTDVEIEPVLQEITGEDDVKLWSQQKSGTRFLSSFRDIRIATDWKSIPYYVTISNNIRYCSACCSLHVVCWYKNESKYTWSYENRAGKPNFLCNFSQLLSSNISLLVYCAVQNWFRVFFAAFWLGTCVEMDVDIITAPPPRPVPMFLPLPKILSLIQVTNKPTLSHLSVSTRIRLMDPFSQMKREYNSILNDADSANRNNFVLSQSFIWCSPGNFSQGDEYL